MLSLTDPAISVIEVTRPRLLLSVQKIGFGVPHFLLTRIIWPPTGVFAVLEAGATRTQDDLPRRVRATF